MQVVQTEVLLQFVHPTRELEQATQVDPLRAYPVVHMQLLPLRSQLAALLHEVHTDVEVQVRHPGIELEQVAHIAVPLST